MVHVVPTLSNHRKWQVFENTTDFVFFMMLVIAMASIALARAIERNKLGAGLEAIRDDEESA